MHELHPENHEVVRWHHHHVSAFGPRSNFDRVPFANKDICLASEFTIFIWLGFLSRFNLGHLASWSTMKLGVVPVVSTITQVIRPLSLMSHHRTHCSTIKLDVHIHLIALYFVLLYLNLLPTWSCIAFNKRIALIKSMQLFFISTILFSLLYFELLKLRATALPLSNFEGWINVISALSTCFRGHSHHVWPFVFRTWPLLLALSLLMYPPKTNLVGSLAIGCATKVSSPHSNTWSHLTL